MRSGDSECRDSRMEPHSGPIASFKEERCKVTPSQFNPVPPAALLRPCAQGPTVLT